MICASGRKPMRASLANQSAVLCRRFRPGQRLLESIVAPEQLARGHEAWRAENAERRGLLGCGAQRSLDLGRPGLRQRRLGVMPEAVDDRRNHGWLTNVEPFAELR